MVMARTSGNILDSEDNGDILLLGNLTTNRFYCAVGPTSYQYFTSSFIKLNFRAFNYCKQIRDTVAVAFCRDTR